MLVTDMNLTIPKLRLEGRLIGLSTDTKPVLRDDNTALPVLIGTEFIEDDTGRSFYFNGSTWSPTTFPQKFDQLVELNIMLYELLKEQTSK